MASSRRQHDLRPTRLDLLARGATPDEVLAILLRDDPDKDRRQVGVVSASGAAATYSGKGCLAWAGGRSGPGYAVQGNILTGEPVVAALEKGFLDSKGKPLAERLYRSFARNRYTLGCGAHCQLRQTDVDFADGEQTRE